MTSGSGDGGAVSPAPQPSLTPPGLTRPPSRSPAGRLSPLGGHPYFASLSSFPHLGTAPWGCWAGPGQRA